MEVYGVGGTEGWCAGWDLSLSLCLSRGRLRDHERRRVRRRRPEEPDHDTSRRVCLLRGCVRLHPLCHCESPCCPPAILTHSGANDTLTPPPPDETTLTLVLTLTLTLTLTLSSVRPALRVLRVGTSVPQVQGVVPGQLPALLPRDRNGRPRPRGRRGAHDQARLRGRARRSGNQPGFTQCAHRLHCRASSGLSQATSSWLWAPSSQA